MRNTILTILAVPLYVALLIFHAYIITIMWDWFVIPVFGLGELSIPYAIGLSLFVGTFSSDTYKETSTSEDLKNLAKVAIRPILALLIGYIALQFAQ